MAYIKIDKPNYYGSYGSSGNIETTALAAIAYARLSDFEFSDKLIEYIIDRKDGHGSWGSTQSTILTLKALSENEIAKKTVKDNLGSLTITLNDDQTRTMNINSENSEVAQYLVFDNDLKDNNEIKITKEGKINATIQIVKDYYRAWDVEQLTSSSFTIDRGL